jgi:hypothetical protein
LEKRVQGVKDSRGQGLKGLFSKDLISAFRILSISAILEGIDTADLLVCAVRPHLSSFLCNLIKGKPPAVPGDSQSLTFPGVYESPSSVNRSKFTEREAFNV